MSTQEEFDAVAHVKAAWNERSGIALQFTELVKMTKAAYAAGHRARAETLRKELLAEIMSDPTNTLFGLPLSAVRRYICEHNEREDANRGALPCPPETKEK